MIKLKYKPSELKLETLTEIANQTEKGLELAVMLSLSDRKSRTEKEIQGLCENIFLVSAIELNRRKGLFEVTKNFNWFTKWKVKMKKMECPKCSHEWKPKKELKNCPNCGLDIITFAEKEFPGLKKIKKSK